MIEARRLPFLTARRLLLGVVLLVAGSAAVYGAVGSARYVANHYKNRLPTASKSKYDQLLKVYFSETNQVNLGELLTNKQHQFCVEIRNSEAYDIELLGFNAPCTCLSIVPNKTTLKSMTSTKIFITLSTANVHYLDYEQRRRELKLTISPVLNIKNYRKIELQISANVLNPVTVSSFPLCFGERQRSIIGNEPIQRVIQLSCASGYSIKLVNFPSDICSVELLQDPHSDNYRMTATILIDKTPGLFKGNINIDVLDLNRSVVQELALPFDGSIN